MQMTANHKPFRLGIGSGGNSLGSPPSNPLGYSVGHSLSRLGNHPLDDTPSLREILDNRFIKQWVKRIFRSISTLLLSNVFSKRGNSVKDAKNFLLFVIRIENTDYSNYKRLENHHRNHKINRCHHIFERIKNG